MQIGLWHINHYLATAQHWPSLLPWEIRDLLVEHLQNLYSFYGESLGIRIARKYLSWHSKGGHHGAAFRSTVKRVESPQEQLALTRRFFDRWANEEQIAA